MHTKQAAWQMWNKTPAHWVKYIEPTFIPIYQHVLSSVMLHEDHALLDVGCGAGLFLSMASPTGALIHGVDASAGMLTMAKQRVPGAFLTVENMHALPYIDGTFDVVTALNSFQYAASFEGAVREARRVVKRHGKLVIGIWSMEANCDARMILREVEKLASTSLPGLSMSGMDENGAMEALCKEVGLRVLNVDSIFCPWAFNSDADLVEGFLSNIPVIAAVQQLGEDMVASTIIESAQSYNLADDVYYLRNFFRVFVTEKI